MHGHAALGEQRKAAANVRGVKKGELSGELDATVYESTMQQDCAELENLKARLRQQQAELALAQQNRTRNRAMRPSAAASQTTVDESEAEANVAQLAKLHAAVDLFKAPGGGGSGEPTEGG